VLLVVHILPGLVAAVPAVSRNRQGHHPRFSTVYNAASARIFLTTATVCVLR